MTPCAVARPAAAPPPLREVRRGVGLLPYTTLTQAQLFQEPDVSAR